MPLKLVLAVATLAFLPLPAEAQQKGGSDSVRDACQEEANQVIKKDRTSRLDMEQRRELRREYAKNCRQKAKTG
ncbi:hypothetical protein ARD30_05085 [Bosea thiooxidans]|uniref:PsiF repeat-containing protein n=2 Tax=Bosea thiooxidans TaxID=53254 RepID=A0A0Q3SWR1_9HYPH|nr:hypothetical protein ARD30_05085 [Bosea thiooxidans]SKB34979.1 hypothetical protein SAMN05660750_00246 [Bosea thiooxidans]